jgi:tRNA(Ile)-lysidine synthase
VSNLVDAVGHSIQARGLLRRGGSVLIAVSGGVDSIVLLHVLNRLAGTHDWRLAVAHFNHQLRGSASDADERFVRKTAERLKLNFLVGRADVAAASRQEKTSIEMAARKLRHSFLLRVAQQLRFGSVALAHQADDQVELFFLRLLRGAGGEGLGGMKWTAPSPGDAAIQLVRPLLGQTKAALQIFARKERLAFREDATNARIDILRNRLRNRLLPLLSQSYQPALTKITLRTMEVVAAENDFVRHAAEAWLGDRRRIGFGRLHPALQRQVIQIQLIEQGVLPDFKLVEGLRDRIHASFSVGGGLTAQRDKGGRVFTKRVSDPGHNPASCLVDIGKGAGALMFDGVRVRWQAVGCNGAPKKSLRASAGREYFDADKVGKKIVIRHWRAGDRFRPIGMRRAVKLQDLFTNLKIPRECRHQLVVAARAHGDIFWVEGVRISERFKLGAKTRRRLEWKWLRDSVVAGGKTP